MLIQALADYADAYLSDQMADPAFESKPVPFMLELSADGTFLGWVSREEIVVRGKQTAKQVPAHEVPKSPVNRMSGAHPLLAFDDVKYLFGPGPWTETGQEKGHQLKHLAFVELLRNAALNTEDTALAACVKFYDRKDQVMAARNQLSEKAKGEILLSVSPDGPVIDRPAVREYWRNHFRERLGERNEAGGEAMCLVSGRYGPIAPTHFPIKGTAKIGGQPSGVQLMSFDKDAFRSYGWEKNANSPVSPDRAQAYVLSLNHLLAGKGTSRIDRNGAAFLFWLRKPTPEINLMNVLEAADPDAVRRLMELRKDGWQSIEPNDFHFLAVSGNGGRLQIREWIHESLAVVMGNVAGWFDALRIVDVFSGDIAPAPKMSQLLAALARDEPPAGRAVELVRRALNGRTIGLSMLAAALSRLRVASGQERLNAPRAGLIRLLVNDEIARNESKGELSMEAEMNPAERHPAYLCGRLLAMFDGLQYAASGAELNQTVADRYYTLASTYPQIAFPKIEDLGMKHLRKLRREKRGAAVRIEREMDEVREALAGVYPGPLSLLDQGRFALGFHHQRGSSIRKAMEAKQQKKEEGDQE